MPETVPTAYRHLVPGPAETANRRFDTVLMGRGTYERGLRDGATSPYPHLRQCVTSSSPDSVSSSTTRRTHRSDTASPKAGSTTAAARS
ncbi:MULTISPECIES: hypothetical protein [Streptomyces]|uniref:Uncharacterized protein n=1 Tax=Streptomyces changanensis TaxID=2964669 RepID=A0ABY5NEJ5_9ACTN|nr:MULTISPECIES: hypothetical protein [Streptomyces]UUS34440.1 hypothetical protein NRO40_28865 [Streptomyces changanensis]